MIIRPQSGPQELFLSSPADIVIYGGAAGGGKSFALLMEPLRHVSTKGFSGIVFRRTTPMIRNQGGLYDEAVSLYSNFQCDIKSQALEFIFRGGSKVKLNHLEHERNIYDHQGAQYAYIGFDELTHFSKNQFFYLLSRNRSVCGVKPYVRATTNPDSQSWVKELISWWLDDEGRYPDRKKAGVLRYLVRDGESYIWGDTPEEVYRNASHLFEDKSIEGTDPKELIKSVTFIPASVDDNQILLSKDPSYKASLLMQDKVQKGRLLHGDWKIRPEAGLYYKREWFESVDIKDVPKGKEVRFWDFAASEKTKKNQNPDYTVGLKLREGEDGFWYVMDVFRARLAPGAVESQVKIKASLDGKDVPIAWEQEGGSSGKMTAHHLTKLLSGFITKPIPSTKDKIVRQSPVSALATRNQIRVVKAHWNDDFFSELEAFPPLKSDHDDQVDALSGAWQFLSTHSKTIEVHVF